MSAYSAAVAEYRSFQSLQCAKPTTKDRHR